MSFWNEAKNLVSGRRPVGDIVASAIRGYRTIRVAVMGSKASGKTVFLTALANHLRDHRPSEFPLGGRIVTWDKYAISGDRLHGLPLFNYEEARGFLSKGEWPRKTTEPSILALRLLVEDRDGKQETVQLEVVDVPGERIADFAMKGRSYKEWCRWMQKESANSDYLAYVAEVDKAGPDNLEALFGAYRDLLSREYGDYAPCITPSTVKLGLNGEKRAGDPAAFRAAIDTVPIGFIDEDGASWEFVPLPEKCFLKDSQWRGLVGRFEEAYDRYARKVVRPVVEWMDGAEKLIYLVDVLTLLQCGAKACDYERQYGEAAISALCPRRGNVLDRMGRWASGLLWKTRVNSVHVVATKADCVCSQVNRDNLVILADTLLGRALKCLDRKSVKSSILPCAAVCSTKERTDGRPGLQGKLFDPDWQCERPTVKSWLPSSVPSVFPGSTDEWDAMIEKGEFNYQFAFPWFDESQICPPKHINLNVLAEAMLER